MDGGWSTPRHAAQHTLGDRADDSVDADASLGLIRPDGAIGIATEYPVYDEPRVREHAQIECVLERDDIGSPRANAKQTRHFRVPPIVIDCRDS
ncbi:hypothetical protein GCM10010862_03490 [Devosia nitrariae]|uniref:Uncharacterized protein n=1 Tax=Devosia nitrariae TaxID=2071872 RepID=A0ABQ5VZM8_9HYPH|nr:hypothetical protein GCM10010862_03490 [Devosia nitrariae]